MGWKFIGITSMITSHLKFVDNDPSLFIQKLKKQCQINSNNFQNYDAKSSISTFYGSFRKAGLDTFGYNYSLEIKFSQDWYEVLMDDEVMQRNMKLQFKRQYHKPLTKREASGLAKKFGEMIFQHINDSVSKLKQKKPKGS